ncbi:MAG: biotin/lipoyl-containing protein [Verrucomicrobiota bacterium]
MSKKKVQFMCTAFRDGFQSVYGARVLTEDFMPAVEAARDAGISYFEAGGGARFQSLYFYCNQDAFAMMDTFRTTAGPDANLQTLARGVNVVGLESQPQDVIKAHADLFKKHGITTIRNFDALNDVNNLIYSGHAITDAGLKHQVCVTLMQLPPGCSGAHDSDFYEKTLRQIIDSDLPFDSVCFKDASGTCIPSTVYETIKRARRMLPEGTFIHYHTHETAGIAVLANKAALDAGADAIDLSMAPCSGGTAQPDILTMWHALRDTEYDLDIDVDKIRSAEEVFKECMKDYFLPPEATAVEPLIPWCPMPGGALTANTQMLRDNGIMEKYPEIIQAMSEVVEKGGFGTSVTPVSQFYFQQAFNNVMMGPWKKIAPSYGQMVLGYFGKTPVEPDAEIMKLAAEQLELEPVTESAMERNNRDPEKGLEPARKTCMKEGIELTDENVFIVATCKEKGVTFLKGDAQLGIRKVDSTRAPAESISETGSYVVKVNGRPYEVNIEGNAVRVNGQPVEITTGASDSPAPLGASPTGTGIEVVSQMPATVYKITSAVGDHLAVSDPVLILEAMKMEVRVLPPQAGTVREILVVEGQQVHAGDVVALLDA